MCCWHKGDPTPYNVVRSIWKGFSCLRAFYKCMHVNWIHTLTICTGQQRMLRMSRFSLWQLENENIQSHTYSYNNITYVKPFTTVSAPYLPLQLHSKLYILWSLVRLHAIFVLYLYKCTAHSFYRYICICELFSMYFM